MKVLITGGGGFLGYRLARELLSRDKNSRITLLDGAFPPSIEPRLKAVKGDIADAATVAKVLEPDTDAVFHLAAVVSGAAEADFDLGMRANLEGTRLLLERCRACTRPPRLVFASSVAAFGGELPDGLDASTTPVPQTSS